MNGPQIIFALQIAVVAVTVLLVASLIALAFGRFRLHGRLNVAFFVLTLTAVLGLEVLIRLVDPDVFAYIHSQEKLRQGLRLHLCFAVPALLLMPVMLYTGWMQRRRTHRTLAGLFVVAWAGTVITGLFFLPTE